MSAAILDPPFFDSLNIFIYENNLENEAGGLSKLSCLLKNAISHGMRINSAERQAKYCMDSTFLRVLCDYYVM